MVAQVEAVGPPPERTPPRVLDERLPSFERPVLDGMHELIEDERRGQGGKAGKEPGIRGKKPLQQLVQRRQNAAEGHQGVPWEEGRLMLVRINDGVLVLYEHDPLPVAGGLPRDARERVVLRVLPVKPAKYGDRRLVEHIAVEDEFHEAVEEAQGEESGDPFPNRGQYLRLPDPGEDELQGAQKDGERSEYGGDETGQRKCRIFMLLGRG